MCGFFFAFLSLMQKILLYETLERVGGGATVAYLKKGDTILCGVLKSASS
jgi:hypothetical protein